MSYLDTKQALVKKLLATSITGITTSDIAIENDNFDPNGKSKFIGFYFIPSSSDTTGKELNAPQEQRGIFQISVYIKLNGGTYDNEQLQIVDDILTGFAYGTTEAYNGTNVSILESSVTVGSENEAWYKRDISINYLTFN